MSRTIRRVAIAAALASTVALAGAASASAATSIIGLSDSAPLIQKLYVPVVMTASCDPDPFFPSGSASVTIRQVVAGKTIAHGTGSISAMNCDGAPHDYTVNVFPDSASPFPGTGGDSPPFQKGDAVVSAQIGSFFGSPVTGGPEPIRLTK